MNEVNNIPEGWVETTLGKVVTFQRGFDLPTTDRTMGNFPLMVSNGQDGTHNEFKVKAPGIVTGRSGSLGNVYFVNKNFWPLNTTLWIKDFYNNDVKFVYYFLKTFPFKKYNSGSGVPTLNRNHIHPISIIFPQDNDEQKSIAAILTSFDDKIELLQAQNKTLEELAQTIFKEWFGKYNIDDELPDGWGVGKLSDFNAVIADFVANGSFASLKENVTLYDYEEYALFMRNTDLKSGFVQKTYVDKKSYEFLSKTKLFGGEIIISNVGDVGSVHFCPYFDIPMTLGNNVIMLKSEFQYYFYTMFNSKIGQHLISSITGGSAQPKFNKTDFRNMGMIIPSEDILLKFEDVASKLYLKILKNKEQIQTLTKTRDELLPKLMSGEIRVKKQFFENFE
jgi:type I restriction enzyme S subunit